MASDSRPFRTPGRPGKGRSAGVVAGRVAVSLLGVAALAVSGLSWYVHDQLTSGLTTSDALSAVRNAPPKLDNSVNLLLIGLDSRKDQNGNDLPVKFVEQDLHAGSSDIGGYNTNTLILIHIPANGGRAQAFSIPRDDYIQTLNGDGTSQGYHKIKEAYGLAKAAADPGLRAQGLTGAALEARGREIGREATLATVQNFLGVHIDHFAEVNLLGFYDIAQVVQPITVCLNADTTDPAINGQGSGASFHKGLNVLNASQALSFVRQRHNLTNGDLDRTHRQQAFISSVEYKLKQDGVLSDLTKMQALLDVVKKDVVIDDQWNILDFAQQAPELTSGNLVFNTLPIQGFATRNGESVNLVDPAQIKRIMQLLIGHDPAPAPANSAAPAATAANSAPATATTHAIVDVYNGSGVNHGATDESNALVALGYTAGVVSSHAAVSHSKVYYGPGTASAAQQIAASLGATAVADSSVPAGHIHIYLGAGFTPPAGTGSGSGSGTG
ncbi:MAG TPA: LCP family protein, partial [Actinocrinis sp.]|uniref:LCP family protein n=1 Tax=Actinocrinis sp. TaxID=1920516 RepID=UPI002DDDBC10